MTTTMIVDSSELTQWFKERPEWLQDAARRLFETGEVTDKDIQDLTVLCKREAGITVIEQPELKPQPIPAAAFETAEISINLKLNAISEVKGINALAPRKPLEFGPELTIVFGSNGSGKTGYTRLLKHACGGRGISTLHGNVFNVSAEDKTAKISYSVATTEKAFVWTPRASVDKELRSISLYDASCAHVYVNEENEVAYEPALLSYFRTLVKICEAVDSAIAAEMAGEISSKPTLPADYVMTKAGEWFNKINGSTPQTDIDSFCAWNDSLEKEMVGLNQRLQEINPSEKAKALRKIKGHVSDLVKIFHEHETELSDEAFAELQSKRESAQNKRLAAGVDAKKVFETAPLEGIASTSWRLLWESARVYSESEAYKGMSFPNVGENARCILCQQPVDGEAKERFVRFEAFVKGSLEKEAVTAEQSLQSFLGGIKEIYAGKDLEMRLDLASVEDIGDREIIRTYCEMLGLRRSSFMTAFDATQLTVFTPTEVFTKLTALESKLEAEAKAFEEDAKVDNKKELQQKVHELKAQKWLSEQRAGIVAEISRQNNIKLLEKARDLTRTKALSDKKSSLSELLVTGAFIERFKNELKNLGGLKIPVELVKTKTFKGQVWHQIKLVGSTQKTAEVLSEGEFRIVSIAAFLADVTAKTGNAPFVFDDPISSLDQEFEELTAARLVALSKSKQVIVFTHRLSLVWMLDEIAKKTGVERRVISVQKEPWGMGEPNDPPLWAQKPKPALNTLIGARLPKARRVLTEQGNTAYQVEAKALCGDARIVIERLIENDLLSDVVQRFRRSITTVGRIENLSKITAADCAFLDAMMTKYSRYEHSQPGEAPVSLPEPDELGEDFGKLKTWLDEFTARSI